MEDTLWGNVKVQSYTPKVAVVRDLWNLSTQNWSITHPT